MELTKEYLMKKLAEYQQAAQNYEKAAAANSGAAEAILSLLGDLAKEPEEAKEPTNG